jgi:hypothetical protein
MTFWKDQLDYSSDPISYSNFGSPTLGQWKDRLGNQERLENLKWARDHCGGLMHVVIIEAIDQSAQPREIARSFPQKRLRMKLTNLDEETGEFSAVNVGI